MSDKNVAERAAPASEHDELSNVDVRQTEDGSRTLFSEVYGQTFHSNHGALTESDHIFFRINGLADALSAGRSVHVLEVGYGTGLNALLLASLATRSGTDARLTSLEHQRISAKQLRALGYGTLPPVDSAIFDKWIAFEEAGGTKLEAPHFQLEVIEGNALHTDWSSRGPFDFVWQDAFSPDANAELWTEEFLALLYASMTAGGVLSTYTVKGAVRRALIAAGFVVEKVAGPPGGKPEVLVATKPARI